VVASPLLLPVSPAGHFQDPARTESVEANCGCGLWWHSTFLLCRERDLGATLVCARKLCGTVSWARTDSFFLFSFFLFFLAARHKQSLTALVRACEPVNLGVTVH